jgi:fatty-acyl-CoA synthase
MLGKMMEVPLNTSALLRHASQFHGDTPIISRLPSGAYHHSHWQHIGTRAAQVACALRSSLGVKVSDRVGTLAWNSHRHLELYYGISGSGAVVHTINPRLFPEQVRYIIDHADDQCVFFDLSFAGLVRQVAPACPKVRHWVALCDRAEMDQVDQPGALCYEDLIEGQSERFDWPQIDERSAAALCYTSGTTGNPKGVLYSHRSMLLHSFALAWPDSFALSASDVVAPAVPMFHVNAWGLPYACAAVGASLAFPGAALDGRSLYELFETHGATFSAAVPTVWHSLVAWMKEHHLRFSTLQRVVIGGSACPPALMHTLQGEYGVRVIHAWGMTETSPLATTAALKGKHKSLSPIQREAIQHKQGRPLFGVDLRVIDDQGNAIPRDGKAFGSLQVRGPWVMASYMKEEAGDPLTEDGWFPTGDVATLDADGYIQITDRSKDVIKSGGEWISSIDLENLAISHPAVAEAAAIAVPHPKWDERPLLIAVLKPAASVTPEELLAFFEGKIAKWWIPDDVIFVKELPHTATGKLLKTQLRQDFARHAWPDVTVG